MLTRARIEEHCQMEGGGNGDTATKVMSAASTAACPYCDQEISQKKMEEHAATCKYEMTWCENKCGRRVPRGLMDDHSDNECPKRLVPCCLCEKKFVCDTLQMHQANCPRLLVSCPNRCNTNAMPREELDAHIQGFCPSATVSCSFKDIGCTYRGVREELERHLLDSTVKHLNLACSVIGRQRQELRALQSVVLANENRSGELYWKVSEFKATLSDARAGGKSAELLSMPFYTGPCGYKLVASLFPNGNGSGEGRYLSLYIKVMPGEFDHVLDWPFAVGLTFTLYDQCPRVGRANVSESFVPDPTWKHFQKPARGLDSEPPLGFGYPRFISHDELRTRNYLRDDSLLIRIRAATSMTNKLAPP